MCLCTSGAEAVRNAVLKVAKQQEYVIDPEIEKLMNQQPFTRCRQDRLELLKRLDFDRETLEVELLLSESELRQQISDLLESFECLSEAEAVQLGLQNGVEQLPTKHCDHDDEIVDRRVIEIFAKWLQQKLLAAS